MRLVPALACLALAGCPKPSLESAVTPDALAAIPRLPAPRAGTYARVPDRPPDPVIAALTAKLRWDASLSGAAAGLALDAAEGNSGLYSWEVREAAWDAGYPYPVSQVRGWTTQQGAAPPADLVQWLGALGPEVDLGLVRARSARGDSWVALVSTPRVELGLQPRQAEIGDSVSLPSVPGAKYTVVDANGRIYEGALDMAQTFTFDLGGEWLFQVSDKSGVAAKYPIYVNMVPPDLALLTAGDDPDSDEALLAYATEVLIGVRDAYGFGPWTRDPLLESAARAALEGKAPAVPELAARVGFSEERLWRVECQAATVEECVDRIVWNPYHRVALVSDTKYWGVAARREQPGVRIVAYVGAE